MRRNSIVFKLFVVTLIVFLFFIATALVFQGIFFERFYSDRKTTDLTASLDTFAELYKTSEWDYGELRNNIRVFNHGYCQ